jgi:uncharacterized protein YsxB (DUF464 family)
MYSTVVFKGHGRPLGKGSGVVCGAVSLGMNNRMVCQPVISIIVHDGKVVLLDGILHHGKMPWTNHG